jgi:hypothetical protein
MYKVERTNIYYKSSKKNKKENRNREREREKKKTIKGCYQITKVLLREIVWVLVI